MANKKADIFTIGRLTREEAESIQAVARGEANQRQQLLTLKVFVDKLSQAHNLTYSPNSFDESAFLAGRAFVGKQLLKIINSPIAKLIGEKTDGRSSTESSTKPSA
jgi:hypothetical protein